MQSSSTRDVHVMDTQPLITPIQLIKEIPISDKAKEVVLSGREQVRQILKRGRFSYARDCRTLFNTQREICYRICRAIGRIIEKGFRQNADCHASLL